MRYLERRRGDQRLHPVEDANELRGDDIFYFNCIGRKEDLDGLHEAVEHSLDIRCIYEQETYNTDYWCRDHACKHVQGSGGLRPERNSFGAEARLFRDGNNDRSLFEAADECYAVRNAAKNSKRRQRPSSAIRKRTPSANLLWKI